MSFKGPKKKIKTRTLCLLQLLCFTALFYCNTCAYDTAHPRPSSTSPLTSTQTHVPYICERDLKLYSPYLSLYPL